MNLYVICYNQNLFINNNNNTIILHVCYVKIQY